MVFVTRQARFFFRGAREEVNAALAPLASFFEAPGKKSTLRSLLFSERESASQRFARSARFFFRGAREEVNASLAPLASFFEAPEKKSTLRPPRLCRIAVFSIKPTFLSSLLQIRHNDHTASVGSAQPTERPATAPAGAEPPRLHSPPRSARGGNEGWRSPRAQGRRPRS